MSLTTRLCLFAYVLLVVACSPRPVDGMVRVDGSSTAYPFAEAVAEVFQAQQPGQARVAVGISGTGGGFRKFCRGATDLAMASRPIHADERQACAERGIEFIELPIAYDAVTVVIHPDNSWAGAMSVAQLKQIWEPAAQGQVLRWSQVDPAWPDQPIHLYGPGTDSGTYDFFTAAVLGQPGRSRRDFNASEDDHLLVSGVAQDRHALGFFGFSYYQENQSRVRAVAIRSEVGVSEVLPSRDSVLDASYRPLSRPILVYVNAIALDQRPMVPRFVEQLLGPGNALVEDVGLIAMPEPMLDLVRERFHRRRVGTLFDPQATSPIELGQRLRMAPR